MSKKVRGALPPPNVRTGLGRNADTFVSSSSTADSKLDSKSQLHLLPELADLNNCNNTLYFEARRHEDLYMWAAKTPNGPSVKLHVQNVHTMDELKLTGNCLKGSRGLLSFDHAFDESEWGRLTKEVFTQVSPAFIFSPLALLLRVDELESLLIAPLSHLILRYKHGKRPG